MKDLVTGRLKEIYDDEKKDIEKLYQETKQASATSIKEAEEIYGKNSPEVQQLKATWQIQQSQLGLYYQNLEQHHSIYRSMYRGFWSKLGGFFKGAFSVLGKIAKSWLPTALVGLIPGLGPIAAPLVRAYQIGKRVYDLGTKVYDRGKKAVSVLNGDLKPLKDWAKGKFMDFLKNPLKV